MADDHLFTVPRELDMGAEARSQMADIDGSHASILPAASIPISNSRIMTEVCMFFV